MAMSAPVRDGADAVPGMARTHPTVDPTAPKPSAQLPASEMAASTTPSTRSAGRVGLRVFQLRRVCASGALRVSKLAPVPQKRPFVSTERMSRSAGLIV
jgi:hypothetical protein